MDVQYQRRMLQTEDSRLCQPISWSVDAILRDSISVRAPPWAILLAMITMRKLILLFNRCFLFFLIWVWGSTWQPCSAKYEHFTQLLLHMAITDTFLWCFADFSVNATNRTQQTFPIDNNPHRDVTFDYTIFRLPVVILGSYSCVYTYR